MLYNELDVLELHLHTIYDYVDRIVLAESEQTFSGDLKPLYYYENRSRFAKFRDKIVHVVIPPAQPGDFVLNPCADKIPTSEFYQRKFLGTHLGETRPNDILFCSDVDEIPNPVVFDAVKGHLRLTDMAVLLRQHWHVLFLNARICGKPRDNSGDMEDEGWLGTVAFTQARFEKMFSNNLNAPWGLRWQKKTGAFRKIKDGGWHMSYMGGLEAVLNKIKATAFNPVSRAALVDQLQQRVFLNRPFKIMELDTSYPNWLQNNRNLMEHLMTTNQEMDELINAVRASMGSNTVVANGQS